MSMITTFEDEPYLGAFTGNVTELCPVGALLPTQYRFKARPWEIVDVPTVCGMCPVGCNTWVDVREGKAQRVRSRNHARGRRGLALRQGPVRVHAPARAPTASSTRSTACAGAASSRCRGTTRSTSPSSCCEAAQGRVVVALSGSETVEQAYALAKLVREGTRLAPGACCRRKSPAGSTRTALPLSAIGDAKVVVVLGDVPLQESAPIVDLWVRAARRNGAKIVTSDERAATRSRRPDLVRARRPRRRPRREPRRSSASPASAALLHPRDAERARRSPTRGPRAPTARRRTPESIGLLIVSGDEAAGDPNVRALAERAEAVIVVVDVPGSRRRLGRPRPAGHELSRARRHVRQPRGPAAAAAPRRRRRPARTSSSGSRSSPHASASTSRRMPRSVFAELSGAATAACSFGEVGERAPLRGYDGAPTHVDPPALPEPRGAGRRAAARLLQAALLRPRRRARARAAVPAAAGRSRALRARTRSARGIATGDDGHASRANGTSVDPARARRPATLRDGVVRVAAASTPAGCSGVVDVRTSRGESVISTSRGGSRSSRRRSSSTSCSCSSRT